MKTGRFFICMLGFLLAAGICGYRAEAATKPAPTGTTPPKPDLIITRISVSSPRIVYGSKDARVIFAVKNQSQAAVQGNIKCQVVGKASAVITVPYGFAAGQEKEGSFLVGYDSTWPVGLYKVKIKADSTNVVAESNETNNESQEVSFEIVPASSSPKP